MIFETNADIQREAGIAERIGPILGVSLIKCKKLCHADYFALDENREVCAIMEIRTRKYTAEQLDGWGGIFLPIGKLKSIYKVCANLNLDFYFVVKTTNCLLQWWFKSGTPWPVLERKYGGRADKRYDQDTGILYLFPTTLFTRIDDDPAPLSTGSP
jgi:hypothetical protein